VGDVIRVNFRPNYYWRLRNDLREKLGASLALRGMGQPELVDALADQCMQALREWEARLTLRLPGAEQLPEVTLQAITEQLNELGRQAALAIMWSCAQAALSTAEAALRRPGK
jgi:hypothetical protein